MLDNCGILFSSIMMLMIIVSAVRQDKARPWFEPIKIKKPIPASGARGRKPRG